jgi:ribose-phosphate pyrophosphokinase
MNPDRIRLLSGSAHPALGERLSPELDLPLHSAAIDAFADGETHVHIGADVRDATVLVVQPTSPPVNDRLMTLALLVDAARAAGAAVVVAVVPYFGYARQDRRERVGDPRSAQVAARLLASVGVDHLVTLDLHSAALESAFPMPTTLIEADEVLGPAVRAWRLHDLTIVSPDAGGIKRAQRVAAQLNAQTALVTKMRSGADLAAAQQVLGDVRRRTCVLVDDLASTGRTLAGAACALRDAGSGPVFAAFTHQVLAPEALERLNAAPIEGILTTDSIPAAPHPRIETVSCVPALARALREMLPSSIEA